MINKSKQENDNSKQNIGLTHLLDVFPKTFGVYERVVERLKAKGLTSTLKKSYNYQTVYQCVKGRWYDPNIHEELALLRKEYIEKQREIKELEVPADI